jgi:iron complex outermembrane receptor protein
MTTHPAIRRMLAGTACVLAIATGAAAQDRPLHIPAGDLKAALDAYIAQTGDQLIFRPEDVAGRRTQGVNGKVPAVDALGRLLAGTGLSVRRDASGAEVITRADPLPQSASSEVSTVQEVVVTAEKREERLRDTPVPVSVLSAQSLVASDQVRLQDYFSSLPGLSLSPTAQGQQMLAIRGITSGGTNNPTVGVVVDDVPFGSSTALGGGGVIPDLDPGDLVRIEELRGPQGTLYGASSMGGLLKFVTRDPSTSGVSGRLETGISDVTTGGEVGWNVRGSVNLPVNDQVAVRASAFTREDPGYVDNPTLGAKGVNDGHDSGGRVALLWRPSDIVSVKLSALIQSDHANGASDVDVGAGLGDLQQSYIRGTGWSDHDVQAYSATISAKLGWADLTSLTGYNVNRYSDSVDFSSVLGGAAQAVYGVGGAPIFDHWDTKKFSQELRLSGDAGDRVKWLVGGFYTTEDSHLTEVIDAENATTGAIAGPLGHTGDATTYEETAEFADLTWRVTDRFDIQVGGRASQIDQTADPAQGGLVLPTSSGPYAKSQGHVLTYLFTPRYHLSDDVMLYARLTSGYRPGGPNPNVLPGVPRSYAPDTTQDYEAGAKGDLFNHALSFDASVYDIEWRDIQLSLVDPTTHLSYNANGGSARTQGAELSAQAHPRAGLTLSGWVDWNNAQLTSAFPSTSAAFGRSGDELPYDARISADLAADQAFPIGANYTGSVGGALNYVGDRLGVFTAGPQRQDLPAYAKLDLRASLRRGEWTLNAYLNNVTDRRGVLNGGLGTWNAASFNLIQPRTIGLSITKTFGG